MSAGSAAVVPHVHRRLHDEEHREPPGEAHRDEQRRQQRRAVRRPGDEKREDRAGAGGQDDAPDERRESRGLRPGAKPRRHQRPQVDGDDREHARVQEHVPREHRREVVVRRGDDHAVGTAEVEHQHEQPAGEEREAQQPRQRRAGLVRGLSEHGTDRRDVEHAGGRDDHEDREDVRHAPDDLVVHAGDRVAVLLHEVRGRQAREHDQRPARRRAPRTSVLPSGRRRRGSWRQSPW